jgi:Uma2 family endonuclease
MIATPAIPQMTPQQYFDWESQQALRYEYFDGEVFAMTGGSLAHGRIGLNIGAFLQSRLRGKGCIVFNSDCKVGITNDGPFTYPDISVSCDQRDRTAQQFIQYPCLIIEVLSPATEAYDRGGKFALYRRLESLQEYVLVGSEAQTVELFRRNSSNSWEFTAYGAESQLNLQSLDVELAVAEVYEDVVLMEGRHS